MIPVALSQRIDYVADRLESRDALDQRLSAFVANCGYVPVPVPNSLGHELDTWLSVIRPSGVILSGGNDISTYPERDQTETALINYAYMHKVPLLGICRGMQMLAHWSGTALRSVQGHVGTRHFISGEMSGLVNSYHRFVLDDCPENFHVSASSEDGEIEAIRHLFLPLEGWMWHPEREEKFSTRDIQRVRSLFNRSTAKTVSY